MTRNLPEHLDRRGVGLGIYLGADRRGRPVAYKVYRERAIRMPRADAEHYIATGQARRLTRPQAFALRDAEKSVARRPVRETLPGHAWGEG